MKLSILALSFATLLGSASGQAYSAGSTATTCGTGTQTTSSDTITLTATTDVVLASVVCADANDVFEVEFFAGSTVVGTKYTIAASQTCTGTPTDEDCYTLGVSNNAITSVKLTVTTANGNGCTLTPTCFNYGDAFSGNTCVTRQEVDTTAATTTDVDISGAFSEMICTVEYGSGTLDTEGIDQIEVFDSTPTSQGTMTLSGTASTTASTYDRSAGIASAQAVYYFRSTTEIASGGKITITDSTNTLNTVKPTVGCTCLTSSTTVINQNNDDDEEPCFSSESTVDVLGLGPTTMVDLKAGDMVRTHSGDYEAVLGFTHHAPNTMGEFKQIFMENAEKPLEMTGNHLVYKSGESAPVAASSLTVGDRLITSSGDAAITKIDTIMRQGLYTPMTASGDVVVDGVKASNYVQLQDNGSSYATFANGMSTGISQHQGIHMFAAPFRMLCQNGFSSVCNSYNEKGYLSWVDSGIKLAKFANGQSFSVQIVMLILALLVFAPIYGIELVGLPAVASVAMGAAVWKVSGLSLRVNKAKTA